MKLTDLPDDLLKEIFVKVDETAGLDEVAQVCREFQRLAKETQSEIFRIGLWYLQENVTQEEFKMAETAARMSTGRRGMKKVNHFLRSSLSAHREGRLHQAFNSWLHGDAACRYDLPSYFLGEAMRMLRMAWRHYRREGNDHAREVVRYAGSLHRGTVQDAKDAGAYDPKLLMHAIITYIYGKIIELDPTGIPKAPVEEGWGRVKYVEWWDGQEPG